MSPVRAKLRSWDGLNGEQLASVSSGSKKTLVNACAGSGKTATAVAKVSGWLESGVDVSDVLMLTFTRKAAQEMKARITRKSGSDVSGMEGGTYHAAGLKLMRNNPEEFGLAKEFRILDESESQSLWKKAIRMSGGDPGSAGFVAGVFGLAVNSMKDPGEALEAISPYGRKMASNYMRLKSDNCVLDFDDILVLWDRALDSGKGGRGKWTHVMVDEFQDNSEIQYSILKKLGAGEFFVVGDPNQCIYSFRGSAPKLMKRFLRENPDCDEFTLSLNYRSAQNILDVANVALVQGAHRASLQSATGGRGQVHKYQLPSALGEAEFTARAVLWRLKSGSKPSDIAILFRSSSAATHVEAALKRCKVAYRKYGGKSLMETADIKDYLSLMRAWHNPSDRLAISRVSLLFPGVGKKSAEAALDKASPEWPAKAKEAELWIRQCSNLGWPAGAVFLASRISTLFAENYPDDTDLRSGRVMDLAQTAGMFGGLSDFLDHYTIAPDNEKTHPDHCVTLSTIHSSKGLEWNDVIICGAGDKQMPSRKAAEAGQVEEERRLFYVATTRARKFLCYTFSESTPFGGLQGPSEFLIKSGWKRVERAEAPQVAPATRLPRAPTMVRARTAKEEEHIVW